MSGLRFDANLKWLFTEVEFEARFAAAAEAGFSAVEFPVPYAYEPAALRRRLDDAGLRQVLINTPMGEAGTPGRQGYACLPDEVPQFRAGIECGLQVAHELGASFLHVVGGIRPGDVSRDRAMATYVLNLAWAVDAARGSGVRLLIEPQNKRDVPGFILDGPTHAVEVIRAIGSDDLRLLFDIYHAQIDEGDLLTLFETVRPWIGHIQIADPPTRAEPGTGELNWRSIFASIDASGYDGWIGCEYRPATETVAGLGWMEEWT